MNILVASGFSAILRLLIKVNTIFFLVSVLLLSTTAKASEDIEGRKIRNAIIVDSPKSLTEAQERLDVYMEMVDQMRNVISEFNLDTDLIIDQFDYEADQLIKFVKDEIDFDLYEGALRGVKGTLRSRSGNSLDQSLVLATLLNDSGYEARIVKSTLNDINAMSLLNLNQTQRSNSTTIDTDKLQTIFSNHASNLGMNKESLEQYLIQVNSAESLEKSAEFTASIKQAESLNSAIQESNMEFRQHDKSENLLLAKEYFWVEYKLEINQPWKVAHVVNIDWDNNKSPSAENYIANSLSDDLIHKYSLAFFIEQEVNGKRTEIPIGDPWESSTALLSDQTFEFSILPFSVLSTPEVEFPLKFDQQSNEVFMILVDGKPLNDTFDRNGNVIPFDAASSAYAAVFATVSDKLNQAAGSLSSIGEISTPNTNNPRISTLGSVKVRHSFTKPDGETSIYERTLYDQDYSSTPNFSTQDLSKLTALHTIRLATGYNSEIALVSELLASLHGAREQYERSIEERFGAPKEEYPVTPKFLGANLANLLTIFDSSPESIKTYRSSPNLIIASESSGIYGFNESSIDIVSNRRRSRLPQDIESLVIQGVWESITEGALLPNYKAPRVVPDDYLLVSDEKTLKTFESQFSLEGYVNAKSNLEKGYIVVLEETQLEQNKVGHWWRISPRGETLRILSNGTGGEGTEYLTQQQIAQRMICVIANTASCRSISDFTRISSYVSVMQKNADMIDMMWTIAGEVLGIPSPPPDLPGGSPTDAIAKGSSAAITAASNQIFKRCIAKKLPQCAVK